MIVDIIRQNITSARASASEANALNRVSSSLAGARWKRIHSKRKTE